MSPFKFIDSWLLPRGVRAQGGVGVHSHSHSHSRSHSHSHSHSTHRSSRLVSFPCIRWLLELRGATCHSFIRFSSQEVPRVTRLFDSRAKRCHVSLVYSILDSRGATCHLFIRFSSQEYATYDDDTSVGAGLETTDNGRVEEA